MGLVTHSRSTRGLARGSSVVNVLVFLAVVAGLAFGGRMLWRKARLDGFHVKPSG